MLQKSAQIFQKYFHDELKLQKIHPGHFQKFLGNCINIFAARTPLITLGVEPLVRVGGKLAPGTCGIIIKVG